jgi:hypothetical protein
MPVQGRGIVGRVIAGLVINGVDPLEQLVCECYDRECACGGSAPAWRSTSGAAWSRMTGSTSVASAACGWSNAGWRPPVQLRTWGRR